MNSNYFQCIYNPKNPKHIKSDNRAVIYARVANNSKCSEIKLERQIRKCQKFIKSMGWKCLKVYTDKCIPTYKKGPSCDQLFIDGGRNMYDFIVCTNISRLSRNLGNLTWELSVTNIVAPILLVPINKYKVNPNKYLLIKTLA